MRFLAILLVCAGCLDYEIRVTTRVGADGAFERSVLIRETDGPKTWKRFTPAGPPYAVTGSEDAGFTAAARFAPGRHPSGIRVNLADPEDEYKGAAGLEGILSAEGTVTVEVTDLGIGTLYWYHETIGLGTDPVKFRAEFARWLETGFDILMEALRTRFKDVDFEPVERKARRELLPRLENAIRTAHLALGALLDDYREHRYSRMAGHWLENPHVQVLLAELKALGFERRKDAPAVETIDQFFSEAAWDIDRDPKLLAEFLQPLERLPAQKRDEIKSYLLDVDDALGDDLGEAGERLYPVEEERTKVEREAMNAAIAGLGGYMTHGIVDNFDFHHEVRLPGRVLKTNGDLQAEGVVRWTLMKEFLMLTQPSLTAYSFAPAPWLERDVRSATDLLKLREELWDLDANARKRLGELAKQAAAKNWKLADVEADDLDLYRGHLDDLRRVLSKPKK